MTPRGGALPRFLPVFRAIGGALALAATVPDCGPSPPIPPAGADVGARGGALAGRIEVTAVDDATGSAIAGAMVRASSISTGETLAERATGADGVALLEASGLTGAITVEVSSASRGQLVMGVRTDEIVIGLPSPTPTGATITGTVRGVPAGGEVSVAVGTPVTIVRTPSLGRASSVVCSASGEGACSFAVTASLASSVDAVATVTDDAGAVTAFVVGEVGAAGGTLSTSAPPTDLAVTLPAATGLTGIVGVPGVARDGVLVLLPQMAPSPGLFSVPALEGPLGDTTYWVIVEARPMDGASGADPDARTVLFARGVRSAAELPRWTSWLPTPDATLDAEARVTFEAVPGADAHVIDWLDARGEILGSAWLIDDTVLSVEALVPPGLVAADVVTVRVRAIESSAPPRGGAFELADLEAGVTRFSERDVAR